MSDTEKLINNIFPLVEDLLIKYGEFFPIGSVIKTDGDISQVAYFDGDEKPLSTKVIMDLKQSFIAKKEDYRSVAIFFDVRVVDPNSNLKTDAVAVFVEEKNNKTACTIYYPYSMTADNKIKYPKPWMEEADREIFND